MREPFGRAPHGFQRDADQRDVPDRRHGLDLTVLLRPDRDVRHIGLEVDVLFQEVCDFAWPATGLDERVEDEVRAADEA